MNIPYHFRLRLLILVCIVFFGHRSSAQEAARSHVDVAIMAGVIAATGSTKEGSTTQYQWADDAQADFAFSPTAALQLEFHKSKEFGARFKTGLTYYNNNLTYTKPTAALDYSLNIKSMRLEVPALVAYHFPNNNVGFYMQAGAGLNFKLKFEDHLEVVVPPSTPYRESDELEGSTVSFNFQGGAGFHFPVGEKTLRTELTFGWNPFIVPLKYEYPVIVIIGIGLTVGLVL